MGAHSLAFLLACSAGAPQDQMSRYSFAMCTPHDHGSAGAPPTVVGGYASLSLCVVPVRRSTPLRDWDTTFLLRFLPFYGRLCLHQPLNGVAPVHGEYGRDKEA